MKPNTLLSPGPWQLRATHTDRYEGEEHVVEVERFIRDADGLRLATIGGGALSPEAADFHIPNARLMTAAPDLLAALERVLASHQNAEKRLLGDGDPQERYAQAYGMITTFMTEALEAVASARGGQS